MSWYYDEGGIERYHEWKFKEKQLERARKKKAILQEKEKKRKQKELKKLMKEEQRLRDIEERKIKRHESVIIKKEELKKNGWKRGYVRQDVLKRNNKAKDLELCKEIYLKAKSGMTTRQLAIEYDRPNNFILRYKYEYEAYLEALREKGESDES
jgi:hypothetical protein